MKGDNMESLVQKLVELIEQGQDVLGAELPDIAQQILAYVRWAATFRIILGIAIGFIVYKFVMFLLRKHCEDKYSNWDIGAIFAGILGGGISTILFFVNLFDLILVSIAPKVVLLRYLSHFVGRS